MSTSTHVHQRTVSSMSDTVIVALPLSKDSFISYINMIRQSMGLPLMSLSNDLSHEAALRAGLVEEKNFIEVTPDRSVYSITKDGMCSWVRYAPRLISPFSVLTAPFNSPEYLNYVLNETYTSLGIHEVERDGGRRKYSVQVFGN